LLSGGMLRLMDREGWSFHDGATGRQLGTWPRARGYPCPGVFPPTVAIRDNQVLRYVDGAEPRILATEAPEFPTCEVSSDGRQLAYLRTSGLRLISTDDGRELAQGSPEPARGFFFTRHGVVVPRYGRIDVLGAAEGNFSIELPEARFGGWSQTPGFGGAAISPDGELVALASRDGTVQAVVVDLRSRSIRGVLHYSPGWPRMAFSLDGTKVFAAGLNDGSALSAWRLHPDDAPRRPRWWTHGMLSSSGGSALLWDFRSGRYE